MSFEHSLGFIGNSGSVILQILLEMWRGGGSTLVCYSVGGLVLGVLMWVAAHLVAVNTNKYFSFHFTHHVFCFFAFVTTFLTVLLFGALKYAEPVVTVAVINWERQIKQDTTWHNATFRKAYEAVFELKDSSGRQLEDFTNYPHPALGLKSTIPTTKPASQKAAVTTFISEAIRNFEARSPLLSWILQAESGSAEEVILKDMEAVFAKSTSYAASNVSNIASTKILEELKKQTPRVVVISRSVLVAAFFMVQSITFGLLIRSALNDIKEEFPNL